MQFDGQVRHFILKLISLSTLYINFSYLLSYVLERLLETESVKSSQHLQNSCYYTVSNPSNFILTQHNTASSLKDKIKTF